jgi:hypothetical protein
MQGTESDGGIMAANPGLVKLLAASCLFWCDCPGAGILLSAQKPSGEWRVVVVSRKELEEDWGPGVETSFALLFLKHSHPMSELTTKLPIKGKELNKGVVEFLTGAPTPQPSVTTPSRSGKPKR